MPRLGPNGRCKGCLHPDRVRIERMLAAGASLKATARKFKISYHALRRHWHGHVGAEIRAAHIAGAGVTKDELEELNADESLSVLDHLRVVRQRLYLGLDACTATGDRMGLSNIAGRLHENFQLLAKLTGCLAGRCSTSTTMS
jgi:hypothetical protein